VQIVWGVVVPVCVECSCADCAECSSADCVECSSADLSGV